MTAFWLKNSVRPDAPLPRASSFADWVFMSSIGRREITARESDRAMLRGRLDHRLIELFLQTRAMREVSRGRDLSAWKPIFSDEMREDGEYLLASRLTVNGEPLRCVPDAVLQNGSTILIIERKTTNVPVEKLPDRWWPNIQAQLWCYGWIDEWTGAGSWVDEVILVAQMWHRFGRELTLLDEHPVWRRSDPRFDAECTEWFQRYGGAVDGRSLPEAHTKPRPEADTPKDGTLGALIQRGGVLETECLTCGELTRIGPARVRSLIDRGKLPARATEEGVRGSFKCQSCRGKRARVTFVG